MLLGKIFYDITGKWPNEVENIGEEIAKHRPVTFPTKHDVEVWRANLNAEIDAIIEEWFNES